MKRLLSYVLAGDRKGRRRGTPLTERRRVRPQVEGLEDRQLLSTTPLAALPPQPLALAAVRSQGAQPAAVTSQPKADQAAARTTLVELVDTPEPGTTPSTYVMRVASTTGFPQDYPFNVRIDNEVMKVLFGEGTTWHVVRGVGTTFMASHEVGSAVTLVTGDFPVKPQPPSSPEPLMARAVSPTQIDLSWNVSQGATGYHVFSWTGTAWKQIADVKAPGTQLHVTSQSPSSNYYFYVEAYNSEGKSATKWVSAKTLPAGQPTSPAPLAARALSGTAVALSWKASQGAGVKYHVYQWNGTSAQLIADLAGTSKTVSGLTPGTTYWFYVQAYNGVGSAYTPWTSATTQQVHPSSPDPLVAKAISGTQVALSWTASQGGGVHYRVYENGKLYGTFDGTSATVSDLTPRTTYQFYVQAYNDAGTNNSAVKTVATVNVPPTTPELWFTAIPGYLEFTYSNPHDADSHITHVFWNNTEVGPVEIMNAVDADPNKQHGVMISTAKLAPDLTYTIYVEAVNTYGKSVSNKITVTGEDGVWHRI
jgi:hypothetical protein